MQNAKQSAVLKWPARAEDALFTEVNIDLIGPCFLWLRIVRLLDFSVVKVSRYRAHATSPGSNKDTNKIEN